MNHEFDTKLHYQHEQLPIFQNRMYNTEEEAKTCPTAYMQLVDDQWTELIYNSAFRPELMVYDASYQNEQAVIPLFQQHPESASQVIARCMGRCVKGVIFTLLKKRTDQPGNIVIEINPVKQGKYLPSTGLLVRSPADALAMLPKGSTIYVMNSNYLEEIKQMSNYDFNYIETDHV